MPRAAGDRARPVLLVAMLFGLVAALGGCAGAQAVRQGYQINTVDLTCDEANRYVQEALQGMGMTITEFRLARPGTTGLARAERSDSRGGMAGTVVTRCEPDGVRIEPDQKGLASGQEFERGVFLGVVGRADLEVSREGRYSTSVLKKKQHAQAVSETASDGAAVAVATATARDTGAGVRVEIEPLEGFTTVLDFEANIAAAGILPVKVTITNSSGRAYDFDPRDIVLRKAGAREGSNPMTPRAAVDLLKGKNVAVVAEGGGQATEAVGPPDASAASELGDVGAASRIIEERALKGARLDPGAHVSGFLYYPVDHYDRARVTMTDVATGETEGFIVEF